MNEINLIKKTLDGEKEAFGQLVLRYQKLIYRLIYRIVGNATESQDIAQEVFITAYQNLERLENPGSFRAWLVKIAKNRCYNWIRQKQDNLVSLDQEIAEYNCVRFPPAPDEAIIKKELYSRVMAAISELPEKDKKVIELFYLEEKSYQEIQQELGISKSALGWRLSEARAKLRQKLQTAYQGVVFLVSDNLNRYAKIFSARGIGTGSTLKASFVKYLFVSVMIHLTLFTTTTLFDGIWGFQQNGNEHSDQSSISVALLDPTKAPDSLSSISSLPVATMKNPSPRRIMKMPSTLDARFRNADPPALKPVEASVFYESPKRQTASSPELMSPSSSTYLELPSGENPVPIPAVHLSIPSAPERMGGIQFGHDSRGQTDLPFSFDVNAQMAISSYDGLLARTAFTSKQMGAETVQVPQNYASAAYGAKAIASSESPGHPASAVIDGEVNSERGWRAWDDLYVMERRMGFQSYIPPDWIEVEFPREVTINRIVVYTIDSPQYPAKHYGVNSCELFYQYGNVWRLIKKVRGNTHGRRIHDFQPVRTRRIKLKLRNKGQLFQSPSPLKYLSQIVEIEAYCWRYSNRHSENPFIKAAGAEGNWRMVKTIQEMPSIKEIRVILPTDDAVWFGTEEALIRFDKTTGQWKSYPLPLPEIQDDSQAFQAAMEVFLNLESPSRCGITSLADDGDYLWVGLSPGSTEGSIYRFEKRKAKWSKQYTSLFGITAIALQGDNVWFGTNNGLLKYNKNSMGWTRIIKYQRQLIGNILALAADSDGQTIRFITLMKGIRPPKYYIFRYSDGSRLYRAWLQPKTDSSLMGVASPPMIFNDSFLWFVSRPSGRIGKPLWRLSVANLDERLYGRKSHHPVREYDSVDGLAVQYVNDIALSDEEVWVATCRGVYYLNLISDTWTLFAAEDGLPDDKVLSIATDTNGVWIRTAEAIARFERPE